MAGAGPAGVMRAARGLPSRSGRGGHLGERALKGTEAREVLAVVPRRQLHAEVLEGLRGDPERVHAREDAPREVDHDLIGRDAELPGLGPGVRVETVTDPLGQVPQVLPENPDRLTGVDEGRPALRTEAHRDELEGRSTSREHAVGTPLCGTDGPVDVSHVITRCDMLTRTIRV